MWNHAESYEVMITMFDREKQMNPNNLVLSNVNAIANQSINPMHN